MNRRAAIGRTGERVRERGAVSTEFAVVVVAVLLGFVTLAVYGGRVVQAENDVRAAAHAAARAASQRGDSESAVAAAEAVAEANLAASGVACANGLAVAVDTNHFGAGGHVAVDVTCAADLSDVASIGVPGTRVFTARAIEVIDTYRSDP